jgi:ankyrin repeat protein
MRSHRPYVRFADTAPAIHPLHERRPTKSTSNRTIWAVRALSASLARDPGLPARAIAAQPDQLVRAAEKNSLDAVALLIELGFDVNAINRTAPLHEAAMRGNLDVIVLLLAHGADPNARDRSFGPTPAGWAEHHHQTKAEK